jgi:hypothetical protein
VNFSIVIAVNKKDLWFCRICVASIRHYYPEVPIYLLKDELNGIFSTKEMEEYWNVQLIEYPIKHFGWSAAKVHFYCDERFKGQRFLVLDADIVFSGRLLDRPFVQGFAEDVIVSEEVFSDPTKDWFIKTYFDYEAVKKFDSEYSFQGFTFNCGQLFCKGGFLDRKQMEPFFDFTRLPAWKQPTVFPLVDQSVFNYLLPTLARKGDLQIGRQLYMLWSETDTVRNLDLSKVRSGEAYPYLVHWAGALRIPYLRKMTASSVLVFFENYYYHAVPFGFWKKIVRKCKPVTVYYVRRLIQSVKTKIK